MHNWSTDEKVLKKGTKAHTIWSLEQMVNFGLDGQKINAKELKKYWNDLNLDPARRRFLDLLLHDKR